MKVSKFKKLVAAIPESLDNAEVIIQKDSEGNGFCPLNGIDTNAGYLPDSEYSGQGYSLKWTADQAGMEEQEWEAFKRDNRCVMLDPTN